MNTLKWTSEKPTAPGWYWWREVEASDRFTAVIHWDASDSVFIDGCRYSKETFNGQFAGPIPEPTDASEDDARCFAKFKDGVTCPYVGPNTARDKTFQACKRNGMTGYFRGYPKS
jgi:hypothetical protein